MQHLKALQLIPIGKIKRFGDTGPKYKVGQALLQLEDGDWLVEIQMVETGEKSEYRLSHILDDPEVY
jgi:hypothetical protein